MSKIKIVAKKMMVDWYTYGYSCSSVVVVEYRTRNRKVWVRLIPGPLRATLSKLLTYCVLQDLCQDHDRGKEDDGRLVHIL